MRQHILHFLLIAIITMPTVCRSAEITINDSSCGTDQIFKTGNSLILRLPANPTTGYSWQVTNLPASLRKAGEPTYQPDSSMIGSGGTSIYKFETITAGKGNLNLVYRRPWEKGQPVKSCAIKITVSD